MKAYLFRMIFWTGDKPTRIWVLADKERTMRGQKGESRKAILVRYKGLHRQSEVAATLTDIVLGGDS